MLGETKTSRKSKQQAESKKHHGPGDGSDRRERVRGRQTGFRPLHRSTTDKKKDGKIVNCKTGANIYPARRDPHEQDTYEFLTRLILRAPRKPWLTASTLGQLACVSACSSRLFQGAAITAIGVRCSLTRSRTITGRRRRGDVTDIIIKPKRSFSHGGLRPKSTPFASTTMAGPPSMRRTFLIGGRMGLPQVRTQDHLIRELGPDGTAPDGADRQRRARGTSRRKEENKRTKDAIRNDSRFRRALLARSAR